ncbi:hypothetical protein [Spongiactinospora gelatinilytica]|uniref:hypothetical protein n=1 Tax=Spongiactinospora gelatinilytica TaxID=2666298 RepID=UPI0018F6AB71|nr:hypothetical protein [Spongiactinospora gelatinilytica]
MLFATERAAEAEVRSRIEAALSRAGFDGPDGTTTRWRFRDARPGLIREDEAGHAERLIQT